jgi:regulator of ribosome biosynthesis
MTDTADIADVAMEDTPMESPSDQIAQEVIIGLASSTRTQNNSVIVTKPIPYTFDLGNLLLNDANPLPLNHTPADLSATARDCAQSLINQLLTACPISSTPAGVHITLPSPSTPIPREKSIPKAKEPTKWELFAAKKGIQAKKRDSKKVYDEATGEWVPKWGYKGKNKSGEDDWIVEVDDEKETKTGEAGDVRKEKRAERKERVKRQDRKMRANEKRAMKGSA